MKVAFRKFVMRIIRGTVIRIIDEQRDAFRLEIGFVHPSARLYLPCVIENPSRVEIGEDASLSAYVHIWGNAGVRIGRRVMIGSHTAITSATHDSHAVPMHGTQIEKPVVIEDDAWIGSHSVIFPGVTIGCGAIVAAGAVVRSDVPPYSVVAGVPAKVIVADRRTVGN